MTEVRADRPMPPRVLHLTSCDGTAKANKKVEKNPVLGALWSQAGGLANNGRGDRRDTSSHGWVKESRRRVSLPATAPAARRAMPSAGQPVTWTYRTRWDRVSSYVS
jgi:hypothetical protein